MVRRSTWILLLIFVVLVGFAWYFQRYQSNKPEKTGTAIPTTALKNLYELGSTRVNDIKIADSTGNQIELYQDSTSNKWAITGTPVDQADSSKIETVNGQLFDVQVQETLTETPPLDSIGLISPTYTITMSTSDGTQLVTTIGSQTAIGSGYYVRVGSGQVVIVDKGVMDDVLGFLTQSPLLPTPTPDVTSTETASPTKPGAQATPSPEFTATETASPTGSGGLATPTP